MPTAMLQRLCADCDCGGFVPTAMLRRLCADCHVAAAMCRLSLLRRLCADCHVAAALCRLPRCGGSVPTVVTCMAASSDGAPVFHSDIGVLGKTTVTWTSLLLRLV